MRFCWACLTLCASQVLGCDNPRPVLSRVEPAQENSEDDVRLTLLGDGFIPAMTLDPQTGHRVAVVDGFEARIGHGGAWADLTNLGWLSTGAMTATLTIRAALSLPAQALDVELVDPRGQKATLENAFLELGPDLSPPKIVFTAPPLDTPVAAGTLLRGRFHASEAPLGELSALAWTYVEDGVTRTTGACPVGPGTMEADCDFQIRVGQNVQAGDGIQIVAKASDDSHAKNAAEEILLFTILPQPTVSDIVPTSGGTGGGTDVVITGSGFLAGSQAVLDGVPLFPNGGIVVDDHTISGHVPAHAEGPAQITVRTPIGSAAGPAVFTFLPPPLVESISPNTGSGTKATAVVVTGQRFTATTRIYFGVSLDSALPLADAFLQSDTAIVGRAPTGNGQATVWAYDESLGFTRLLNGFTWRTP